jgi:hypothetical protein
MTRVQLVRESLLVSAIAFIGVGSALLATSLAFIGIGAALLTGRRKVRRRTMVELEPVEADPAPVPARAA